jgi:hypothetical protein
MSSITFDASLNTDKLDSAIKESNKTVKEWAQGVEKAGGQADQGLNKMAKSFKDTIKDQKLLIKSIEEDVKRLQKAYDDAAAGKVKSAMGEQVGMAKRALKEEQATLLGLQKQQIEANNQTESSQGKIISSLGKWVGGLVTVGAALKIAKSIIASTEGSAHKFEVVVAEATAGVGYFFKAIASGDWSNFGKNLEKAIKGAKDYVDAMEVITNKQNEQKVKSSELDKEIAALRDDTYDKDEKNNKTRQDALTKIVANQEEKYTAEAKLAKELYETNLKKAATDSGLSEKQIENFIKEYSSLEKLLELGKRWKTEFALIRESGTQAEIEAAQKASLFETQISKVVPATRAMLSGYMAAANEAEAAFGQKNRRDKMQLAEVTNKIKEEAEAVKKKAIEDAKTENQIKIQTELLNKAIDEGNQIEIKAIGERIRKLQEELVVRQRIAEAAIAATITRETPLSKITGLKAPILLPGGLKIPSTLAGAPITAPISDYIPGTAMLSDAGKIKQKKKDAEYDKNAEESLKRQLELRNEIVNAAANLIYQIGQQIGLDEKSMSLLNAGLNAFTALATGDIVGAALSMLSGIIAQIPSAASRFEAQIEHINSLLEEQARLIELSEQTGGQEAARKKELDFLKEKERLAKVEYERLQKSADQHLDLLGWRQKKANEANQAWKEVTNEIEDSNSALYEFYTDTTASSIADAISQGFQDGKTSAADFAETFNDFMVKAINSALTEMSKPEIAAWYKNFAIDMESGGGLSKEEIAALRIDWDKIIAEGKANRDAVESVTGVKLNTGTTINNGLSMGIQRQISEQTGTELAGLFRRFADDNRQTKDYTLAGLNHLVGIEANTFNTVVELQKAVTELQAINSNTKQAAVAGF